MKVLILGPNGLVGSTITKFFINNPKYQTYGFLTDISRRALFNKKFEENFYLIKNFLDFEELEGKIKVIAPNIVINCLGMTNKVQNKNKSINLIENYIKINSLLPH